MGFDKINPRKKRHLSIRKKIFGTSEAPRLVVFRSSKHIYVSVVIDEERPNKVLTGVSSLSKEFGDIKKDEAKGGNIEGARIVGELIAKKCKTFGIEKVSFDRGGYKYAGRVKFLAESARKGGLKF